MARILILLTFVALVVACGSDHPPSDGGPGTDAGPRPDGGPRADSGPLGDGSAVSCDFVDELDRACTDDDSCAVGVHQTDCCGSTVALGLAASESARFDTLEPACRATYPGCGCPAGPTTTDSGETTFDASSIQVGCISGGPAMRCLTYVTMRPPDTP